MPDRKTVTEQRHEAAVARRRAIAACGRCDPNGWLETASGALARCRHDEQTEGSR